MKTLVGLKTFLLANSLMIFIFGIRNPKSFPFAIFNYTRFNESVKYSGLTFGLPFLKWLMFIIYLLILGAFGITAQIILLRQLLLTAQGNELAIGLILGLWVIGESLGAFSIKRWKRGVERLFFLFNSLFAILLPLVLLFPLLSRNFFGLTYGEILILPQLGLLSLITILPVSFLHGALFPISAAVFAQRLNLKGKGSLLLPIGQTYIFETGGTILGGLLLYFILLPLFSPFRIAFLISFSNLLLLFLFGARLGRRGYLLLFSLIPFFLFIFEPNLRPSLLSLWWEGENLIHYENTRYGNITITEKEGEYTLFYDNFPLFTIPNPDLAFLGDLAHFSLLSHPRPKTCLLIGQGLGGLIREFLKHPIERLDYLELDPRIIETYKTINLSLIEEEIGDRRVNLFYRDGREFLKERRSYDVVVINHLLPLTLNFNRYFTREFYLRVRERLRPNGILVTISPSSLTYLSEEVKNLVLTHYWTKKSVFPYVYTILGDINLYIASEKELSLNLNTFQTRWSERKIEAPFFSLEYLKVRLAPHYYKTWEEILGKEKVFEINSDLRPKGFLRSLSYLTALSSPRLPRIYGEIEKADFKTYLLLPLLFFGFALIFSLGKRRDGFIPFILFATGFWGMAENILLIFFYQIRFGYLFTRITLLITLFMLGASLGSLFSLLLSTNPKRLFFLSEVAILFFSLFLLSFLKTSLSPEVLFLLTFAAGLLLGFPFPLANSLYLEKREKVGETVGVLFASDLLGGALGAFLSSLLLIPTLGIIPLQKLIILFKFSSLILATLFLLIGRR